MTKCRCLLACSIFMILGSVTGASGAIVISGDPAAGSGLFSITEEMTFDIVADSTFAAIVFDEWVSSDGTATTLTPLVPNELSYRINLGPVELAVGLALIDNQTSLGSVGPNDGFIRLFPAVPIAVAAGDVLTIPIQALALPAGLGFNPDAIGVFNGEVFVTDGSATRISSSMIPEPGAALLSMLSVSGLAFLRRRKKQSKN